MVKGVGINVENVVRVAVNGGSPTGHIPFQIRLDEKLEQALVEYFSSLKNNSNFAVNIIKCRGANSKMEKVAAIVTIQGNQSFVRCLRIVHELEYLREGIGKSKYDTPMCYCGKENYVPFVVKEDFASNEIFECPYAK
jgi:hypothetical protein